MIRGIASRRISHVRRIIWPAYLGMKPSRASQLRWVALETSVIACGPILPALMMVFSLKTRKQHRCRCGMLAGFDLNLVYIFLFLGWFFVPGTAFLCQKHTSKLGCSVYHHCPLVAIGPWWTLSSRLLSLQWQRRRQKKSKDLEKAFVYPQGAAWLRLITKD